MFICKLLNVCLQLEVFPAFDHRIINCQQWNDSTLHAVFYKSKKIHAHDRQVNRIWLRPFRIWFFVSLWWLTSNKVTHVIHFNLFWYLCLRLENRSVFMCRTARIFNHVLRRYVYCLDKIFLMAFYDNECIHSVYY